MQTISDELQRLISSRLKLGDRAKPRIRIEVDKLAFIPGRSTQLEFIVQDVQKVKRLEETWIEPSATGSIDGSTVVNSSGMVFPIQGGDMTMVTSPYGNRSLGGSPQQFHNALDFASGSIPIGTPILSAWDGVVTRIRTDQPTTSWGHYVVVRHADGYYTKYCHLKSVTVKVGQSLTAGQQLGTLGNSGLCYSGGVKVNAEMRAQGRGAHLHFELWTGCSNKATDPFMDGGKNAKHIDPAPYLKGIKKIAINTTNVGGGVVSSGNSVEGITGGAQFKELLKDADWSIPYTKSANFNHYKSFSKDGTYGWAGFLFNEANATKAGETSGEVRVSFSKSLSMLEQGSLSFRLKGNFKQADGDAILVYINNKIVSRFVDFKGNSEVAVLKDIYVPKGTIELKFEVVWGGKYEAPSNLMAFSALSPKLPKMVAIADVSIESIKDPNQADSYSNQTGSGHYSVQEIEDFVFNDRVETVQLEVGDFIYEETLVVDTVQTCEVNYSLEQECAEASFTIGNPNGFFDADYAAYKFPELFHSSPWSYRINGMQVGVFSENTPVRIYMGYGDNLIRVFTGLVDKVDVVGAEGIMTVSARDMYKKVITKVLTEEKAYPKEYVELLDTDGMDDPAYYEKVPWLKTAVVQDLVAHVGMFGWRQCADDLNYADAVIEESYLIEVNQATGKVIKAVADKPYTFESAEIGSIPSPQGWLNPYVEVYGKSFKAFEFKVADCVNDVIKDTNYRSYCDRYGTYRLEQLDYLKPVVAEFTEYENLVTISKSFDFVRGRSHIMIKDDEGGFGNFIDKEMLFELKGELRTAVVQVDWARTDEAKKEVATRMFYDMKRLCRTIQAAIPGNPALDVLDRVVVTDKSTAVRDVYNIKGIRHTFNIESGYMCVIDLMWSRDGTVI